MQVIQDVLLVAARESENKNDRELASYCLNHLEGLPDCKITDLAEACHVSPAGVTRFVRGLGYDSFLHFKDECRFWQNMMDEDVPRLGGRPYQFDRNWQEKTTQGILHGIYGAMRNVDTEAFRRLARDIKNSGCVVLMGQEFSAVMMDYLQIELQKCGKSTWVQHNTATLRQEELDESTVFVVFSMTGMGLKMQREYLPRLVPQIHKLWVVTDMPLSEKNRRILRPADEVITVNSGVSILYHHYVELFLVDLLLSIYREECEKEE